MHLSISNEHIDKALEINKELKNTRKLVNHAALAYSPCLRKISEIEDQTIIEIENPIHLPQKLIRTVNGLSFDIKLESNHKNAITIFSAPENSKETTKLIKEAISTHQNHEPLLIYVTLKRQKFIYTRDIIENEKTDINMSGGHTYNIKNNSDWYIANIDEKYAYIFYIPYEDILEATRDLLEFYPITKLLHHEKNFYTGELRVHTSNPTYRSALYAAVDYMDNLIKFLKGRQSFPSYFPPSNYLDLSSDSFINQIEHEDQYTQAQLASLKIVYETHKNISILLTKSIKNTSPTIIEISLHQQLIRGLRHISSDKHLYLKGNQDVTIRNENDITSSLNSFINDSSDNFHSAVEVNRNAGRVDLMLSSSNKETIFLCECKIIGRKKHTSNSEKIKLLKNDKDAIRKSITQIKQYLRNSKKNIGYIIIYAIDLSPEETITSMSQLISEMNEKNEALSISLISTPSEFSESIPCYKLDNKDNYNIRIVVCQFDTKSPTENFK